MSERYRPRRLIRERVDRLASGAEHERELDVQAARRRAEISDPVAFFVERNRSGPVVYCQHGINWLLCRSCSTPRS